MGRRTPEPRLTLNPSPPRSITPLRPRRRRYVLQTQLGGAPCAWCYASAGLSFSLLACAAAGLDRRALQDAAGPGLGAAATALLVLSLGVGPANQSGAAQDLELPYVVRARARAAAAAAAAARASPRTSPHRNHRCRRHAAPCLLTRNTPPPPPPPRLRPPLEHRSRR